MLSGLARLAFLVRTAGSRSFYAHGSLGGTAGSRRCAESEAAAIVTKVTVGQYVKLQVWTMECLSSTPGLPMRAGCVQSSAAWRRRGRAFRSVCRRSGLLTRRLCCLGLSDARHGAAPVTMIDVLGSDDASENNPPTRVKQWPAIGRLRHSGGDHFGDLLWDLIVPGTTFYGAMFWFARKTFCGSYARLSSASRSHWCP